MIAPSYSVYCILFELEKVLENKTDQSRDISVFVLILCVC
jgi:hypothetical protein